MKNSALDLHGIRHDQVARTVENFVLLNQDQIPLEIICGNSQRMIDLVISVLDRIASCSSLFTAVLSFNCFKYFLAFQFFAIEMIFD